MKTGYILHKTLVLITALLISGGGSVWGQQTPPDKLSEDELLQLLRNHSGTDTKDFLNKVDNGDVIFSSLRDEDIREEPSRWVYDVIWTISEDEKEITWPTPVSSSNSKDYDISITNPVILGNTVRDIYTTKNDTKTIVLQKEAGANLDGFIRWYVTTDPNSSAAVKETIGLSNYSGNSVWKFKNGIAWLRPTNASYRIFKACVVCNKGTSNWALDNTWTRYADAVDAIPSHGISSIKYTVPTNASVGSTYYVVCEASASNEVSSDVTNNTVTIPRVAVKYVYQIHVIDEARTNTELSLEENKLPIDNLETFKANFLEHYEIHTPIETGTNYRLAEPLANYYIPNGNGGITSPTYVRWRAYDSNGERVNGKYGNTYTSEICESGKNIVKYTFPYEAKDTEQQLTYYLTAEVGTSENGTFYPVSFLTVYLEPFSMPLTEEQLSTVKDGESSINYQYRFEDYLTQHHFETIDVINFDFEKGGGIISGSSVTSTNNYSTQLVDNFNSYYAFADLTDIPYRRDKRLSVGRGEFALYRTLNYPGISKQGVYVNGGIYNDYFADFYNNRMVDRLWEKTKGDQSGYFMYLDATDEAGVITKVDISQLCPNTTLLVTAWICDMAHSTDAEHADVGFTLKKKGSNNTEEILYKFYSGMVENSPAIGNSGGQANWQQIYFRFSIPGGSTEDEYILEIANNTPSSNGADYGIDDIRIYKSTPDISVERQDACHASTLNVSSDYETLLRNMGWSENPDVANGTEKGGEAKWRYGFGNNSYIGNVLFGCVDNFGVTDDWVKFNEANATQMRVVVPTNLLSMTDVELAAFPSTQDEALTEEIQMNILAVKNYIDAGNSATIGDINLQTLANLYTTSGVSEDDITAIKTVGSEKNLLYESSLNAMYGQLNIPRICHSWYESTTKTLYMAVLNVEDTDLKYQGEAVDGGFADGEYEVVLWAAGDTPQLNDACLLHSPFKVKPSITITIETDAAAEETVCAGEIRTFKAYLWAYDSDGNKKEFSEIYKTGFTFDWFLGNWDEYEAIVTKDTYSDGKTLQALIKAYRKSMGTTSEPYLEVLNVEDIQNSSFYEAHQEDAKLLISLLGDKTTEPKVISGSTATLRWVTYLIAMPYIPNSTDELGQTYEFCTETQGLQLSGDLDVPNLSVGFPNVDYNVVTLNTVPLRLGLRHILNGIELPNVPIQNAVTYGSEETAYLGVVASDNKVFLRQNGSVYTPVGEVTKLYAKTNNSDSSKPNELSIQFMKGLSDEEKAKIPDLLKEGEIYSLYVPFGEYDDSDNYIEGSCIGYAVLQIKIVPEFLTWQKGSGDVWYNDSNWEQSTKGELYVGGNSTSTEDANGSDNVANAFAPLYFTKITIPGSQTLELENPEKKEDGLTLNISTDSNIQYEMAVDTNTVQKGYKISPYYINKVSEIYFKPNAQLRHQQYLIYNTARVDFEMAKDAKYWMASPLQDVFAGDMYAPKGTARQETYAFDPIFYSENAPNSGNDRQNPAFYQKAWDKGITMYTNTAGTTSTSYSVVNSNWSIEYNDVNVPYALGKGFYASVEEFTNDEGKALVRLPKADDGYKYEELKSTKALSTIDKRPNTGKLAGEDDIIVVLSDSDDKDLWGSTDDYPIADGDGKHFLLGNPYMYPLDIKKFLTENTVLAQKYWTLSADGTLSVGTPDVAFTWTDGTTVSGEIAPMQAFFVELQDSLTGNSSKQVTFKTNMMVEPETKTTLRSTTATHPVLALRAEKNNLQSIAFVTVRDDATNAYESDKDAVVMIDSELTDIPQVYTVAGDRAAGVNAVKSLVNVPLGVYAASDKEEVTLTIEGVSNFIGTLYLYDAVTGKSQALVGDSHTFYVTGSTHGRYFLRSSESPTANETVQADAISIYSAVPGKVVVSATERLKQVQVFTTSGTLVRSLQPNQSVHTFDLSQGLYLIRAVTDGMVKTEKVLVR